MKSGNDFLCTCHIAFTARQYQLAGRFISFVGIFGIGGHPKWNFNTQTKQEIIEVAAPTDGYHNIADGIFQDQRPAYDPGNQLAKTNIGIGISASTNGNPAGKFGIAQSTESAGNGGNYKQEGNAGATITGCRPNG